MRIVSHDYIMRDDWRLISLSIVVKKIKIIQEMFQKEHRSELRLPDHLKFFKDLIKEIQFLKRYSGLLSPFQQAFGCGQVRLS